MSPIFRKSKPPLFSETNLIYRSTGKKAESESPIPGTTIILERLRKRGYVSLLEMYEKIPPSRIFRETAVYETRLVYPELVEGYLVFRQAQQDCERRCTALC